MAHNDQIPPGRNAPDDDKWNALRAQYERSGAAPEPEAPAHRRAWVRNTAMALSAAAVAFGVLKLAGYASEEDTGKPAAAPAAPATPGTRGTPSAPGASATPAGAAARPPIPLADAFPASVPDGTGGTYTKVGSATPAPCAQPGTVGPRLADLIAGSKGCVGQHVALYKDARDNQFNVVLFTMKDPRDTLTLVNELGTAFDDYQVAAQAPPPASGLPTLPPDSGMVQSFTMRDRVMVVGLGQWSDGRTADFQQLVDRLQPLQEAIVTNVGRYETP
ncbi:hypothetical protein [Streptomyces sp. Isolate_45]|uniref:hypothetical protein n=1 Tax=unclassified Streptomyces TaxID=2593676 RepID=UPI002481C4DF|nr:hypothetical protein [Streptomyces sp. Isolate_45]MDA5282326.1 hypothetical protein [Streptomyces sp. Isolate_45]